MLARNKTVNLPHASKNSNETWANNEVIKFFQITVNDFVKFYKAHGKDKNRDSFLFIRLALKQTLALLFQNAMPKTSVADLFTTDSGIKMILSVIDKKKIGKEKHDEFKDALALTKDHWNDFCNLCKADIRLHELKIIAEKKRLKEETDSKKLIKEDPFVVELTHRVSEKKIKEVKIQEDDPADPIAEYSDQHASEQTLPATQEEEIIDISITPPPKQEPIYAQSFLYSREELNQQIHMIGAPKPRNYSPLSIFKHAFAYYPISMGASILLEVLGGVLGGLEWVNNLTDDQLNKWLHSDQTGITAEIIIALGAVTIGGITLVTRLIESSKCNAPEPVMEDFSSETDSEEELDSMQNLTDKSGFVTEEDEVNVGLLNDDEFTESRRYRGP